MEPLTAADQAWLKCYDPRPDATLRLVCLPHAGGAAPFYRGWSRHLPPEVEVLAVGYPGRQERFAEPCLTTMDEMADRLADVLAHLADRPLAVFGHSMGAFVGYETARRLVTRHGLPVAHLFVSGTLPPHLVEPGTLHLASDEALVADVVEAGAGESAVLADPDLREILLPSIRADYRLVETYRSSGIHPLDCPLTGFHGDADEDVLAGDFTQWSRYASGPTTTAVLPGGHFYPQDHDAALVGAVARALQPLPTVRGGSGAHGPRR